MAELVSDVPDGPPDFWEGDQWNVRPSPRTPPARGYDMPLPCSAPKLRRSICGRLCTTHLASPYSTPAVSASPTQIAHTRLCRQLQLRQCAARV